MFLTACALRYCILTCVKFMLFVITCINFPASAVYVECQREQKGNTEFLKAFHVFLTEHCMIVREYVLHALCSLLACLHGCVCVYDGWKDGW